MRDASLRSRLARWFECRVAALIAIPLVCISTLAGVTRACPYSIRDSAFMSIDEPALYELYFLAPKDEAARGQLAEWVAAASETWLADTNVSAQVIEAQGRESERLRESLARAEVDSGAMPSVVLFSPEGDALAMSQTPAAELTMDDVMDAMVRAAESPARLEMRDHLVESWCVVILMRGDDQAEADRAAEAIGRASVQITGTTTEMDKVVITPPHVIVVDRDGPAEKVLRWSLGLADGDSAAGEQRPSRAIMLAGRGRQRGPVFEGDELNAERLLEAFTMLGRSCSCTTSPLWLSGKSLAIRWGPEMEDTAQIELGFDPNDPEAIELLRGTMGQGRGVTAESTLGYSETLFISAAPSEAVQSDADGPAEEPQEQQLAVLASADSTPSGGTTQQTDARSGASPAREGFATTGMMIMAVLAVLAVATTIVFRRARTA